jgi:hypothetical protein
MDDGPDPVEPDWQAYRKAYREKVRRRFAAGMALVIAAVGLFVIGVRTFTPQNYPPGDIRNEPLFRVALAGFFLVLIVYVVIETQRALRRGG